MVTQELQNKIDKSIKLLRVTCGDDVVELSYSGGKDSDAILQLAKEAGINYRAIYKNTTIDPPGTIQHVREMGVEVMQPRGGAFIQIHHREQGVSDQILKILLRNIERIQST